MIGFYFWFANHVDSDSSETTCWYILAVPENNPWEKVQQIYFLTVKRSTSWWWLQLGGKIDWRFRRVPNFPEFMCFPFWKDRLGPPWSCTCCAVLTVVSPHRKLGTRCVWRRSDIIDAPGHSHLPCPERTGPPRITQNPGTAYNVAA